MSTNGCGRFTSEDRCWLLGLARHAIAGALAGENNPVPESRSSLVDEKHGCFVSLHTRAGELRGCIGTFEADAPLWRNVIDMAISAATRDPRFSPLLRSELVDCVLEISVLTPRRQATAGEVVVGQHGIWISRDCRRGVLLPQVAVEYDWDSETFLDHTCLKAGLSRHAWRDPATLIEVFEAEVFGETSAHELK